MAFAVVDIAGFQENVTVGAKLSVPSLRGKEGEKIPFSNVLLMEDKGTVRVGQPFVSGASVEAKVIRHGKAEKIRVFKMKLRKRYRRTQGHRQPITEIEVTKING